MVEEKKQKENKKEKTENKLSDEGELSEDFLKYLNVLNYPLSTEKVIKLIDSENKIVFDVHRKARKEEIKKAIEMLFNLKVISINTLITPKGRKRAYVKFSKDVPAMDIATQLKMM